MYNYKNDIKQKIAAFLIFIAHKSPKHHVSLRYFAPDCVSIGIAPD